MNSIMDITSEKPSEANDISFAKSLCETRDRIKESLHHIIIGQNDVIDLLLIALFSQGHCLFEGVPGLAKTLLVNTLANIFDLSFNRIQFTPDLMPSDITGTEILEEDRLTGKRKYQFIHGPLFTHILLADEINRTPPKTQAALLQAMQEYRITAAGKTYELPQPFLVFATQNPLEQEGTYPLPEAQLDRFMLHILVNYPSFEDEVEIVSRHSNLPPPISEKILTPSDIIKYQEFVKKVPVPDHVIKYAVRLVRLTRPQEVASPDFIKKWLDWGAGPRASQFLILGAKTRAILNGRFTADISDIKFLSHHVLRHRIVRNYRADAEKISADLIIDKLLQELSII